MLVTCMYGLDGLRLFWKLPPIASISLVFIYLFIVFVHAFIYLSSQNNKKMNLAE